MQSVNKTTAALLAGAAVTILSSLLSSFGHFDMSQEVSGAVQTLLTAGIVYFSPANKPA